MANAVRSCANCSRSPALTPGDMLRTLFDCRSSPGGGGSGVSPEQPAKVVTRISVRRYRASMASLEFLMGLVAPPSRFSGIIETAGQVMPRSLHRGYQGEGG